MRSSRTIRKCANARWANNGNMYFLPLLKLWLWRENGEWSADSCVSRIHTKCCGLSWYFCFRIFFPISKAVKFHLSHYTTSPFEYHSEVSQLTITFRNGQRMKNEFHQWIRPIKSQTASDIHNWYSDTSTVDSHFSCIFPWIYSTEHYHRRFKLISDSETQMWECAKPSMRPFTICGALAV